ncbi:MAG: hypothetical protein IPF50_00495 [Proteobacteria bacterium]|nr:hypothetical protein [Pseudomonadota bacterium]
MHRLHDEEVERLLAAGERRAELTALFGDRGYRQLSALARRSAATRRRRCRAYVLPGVVCRLGLRGLLLDDVLWVDLIEVSRGTSLRLKALPAASRLVALGAMRRQHAGS